MSYPPEVESALSALAKAGLKPGNYAPPIHRLLWRVGIHVPPPHFASFTSNLLLSGVWFGSVWGATMWFLMWSAQGMSIAVALGLAAAAGILFGLCMSLYYRHGARKYRLPAWSEVLARHG